METIAHLRHDSYVNGIEIQLLGMRILTIMFPVSWLGVSTAFVGTLACLEPYMPPELP